MNKKDVTITDIANLAGTSVTTVSRILSGSSLPIRKSLQEKVLEIAQAEGYVHKAQRRSREKRPLVREIALIIPNVSNPYYTLLLDGVQGVAARHGFALLLCNTQRDAGKEAEFLESLIDKRVQGVIAVSINSNSEHLKRYQDLGNFIVSIEQNLPIDCCRIDFNYYRSGLQAADHLYGLGHRRFALFSSPINRYSRSELRRGYVDGLKTHGIAPQDILVLEAEHEEEVSDSIYEFQNGKDLAMRMLAQSPHPTAIFCNNDMTAFGAMQALQRKGYAIPDDFSIVGFDNIPFCQVVSPPLTTVDQCTAQIGSFACDTLIKRLTGELTTNASMVFEPTLVVRESTDKSPAAAIHAAQ